MKKMLFALLFTALVSVSLLFSLTACSNKCEQHVYDDCADTECNVCGDKRDSMHTWTEADCTTAKNCSVCGATEGSALGHEWTTPDVNLCEVQSTCSRCGATDGENKEHVSANDDNDCSTALNCGVCGEEILAAGEHSPEKDDGNCTTEQKCIVCSQVAVAAKDTHNDTDHDYLCDNTGCQVTVGNPPKDTNPGIDLPIDEN